MRFTVNVIGQVPKDKLAPDTIEDHYDFNTDKETVVISDGASESYDSKTLAKIICKKYIKSHIVNLDWVGEVISEFSSKIDIASLSWSKEAAYERGSFATLLAIKKQRNHNRINILGIGDSIAILIDENRIINTFPYNHSEEFRQHPQLISTNPDQNGFIGVTDFSKIHKRQWELSNLKEPIILCMTDSLGEWVLRNQEIGDLRWMELLHLTTQSELTVLVDSEWEKKEMRKDDITLVKITFSDEV
ncbi:MAG TPA: hypothetical protein DCG34_01335 [Clostridiales bacterium]|jgi:hypothetical protein|nr:hypothetical protein [Clostridiales bacterium]